MDLDSWPVRSGHFPARVPNRFQSVPRVVIEYEQTSKAERQFSIGPIASREPTQADPAFFEELHQKSRHGGLAGAQFPFPGR